MNTETLSWTPIRKGKLYCSPACGCGCTLKAYLSAQQVGAEMKAAMKRPKDWKVEVWENLGWHVCITNGLFTIGKDGRYYFAHYDHTFWHKAECPNRAVNKVIGALKAEAARLNAAALFLK